MGIWFGVPGGAGFEGVIDTFAPTSGQVTFILSQGPTDTGSFQLFVNGVEQSEGVDYTVSGTNLTWLNSCFVLEPGDTVRAYYI